ncbi:MAG: PEGA domain-containing protein [Bacteroidetes bacterium]|nr:PEGA domain-containing protein [Bacteroidota bacterium]
MNLLAVRSETSKIKFYFIRLMKKIIQLSSASGGIKLYIISFLLLLLTSCREGIVEFQQSSQTQTAVQTANIYISSFPSGADIYWENNSTNKVTPDSLIGIQPGSYTVKLRLVGYADQSVPVVVTPGQKKYIDVRFN